MKELTLKEIKKSQIETLIIFRNFCEKNNLKNYLAFGTLLGAVRHKGFVPWDDDVDVYMPREDYDFLIKHFNDSIMDNRMLVSKEKNEKFYLNSAKIIDNNTILIEENRNFEIGVWIDIFPLEYIVDNKIIWLKANIYISMLSFLSVYVSLEISSKRAAYKNFIIRIIKFIFPSKECLEKKRKEQINKITAKNKTNTYGLLYRNFGTSGIPIANKNMFEPSIKLEFEKQLFDVPKEYHKILVYLYGRKYMILPPIEKQISNHSYVCYWKEENR